MTRQLSLSCQIYIMHTCTGAQTSSDRSLLLAPPQQICLTSGVMTICWPPPMPLQRSRRARPTPSLTACSPPSPTLATPFEARPSTLLPYVALAARPISPLPTLPRRTITMLLAKWRSITRTFSLTQSQAFICICIPYLCMCVCIKTLKLTQKKPNLHRQRARGCR